MLKFVRPYTPDELDHRGELLQRRDRVRERGLGGALERRRLHEQVGEVVAGALAVHERVQVGDRRACLLHERAQLAQEAREVLGRRLGGGHQDVEVVERRAQVHEGRVGLAQGARQQRQRLVERCVLAGDGRRRRVGVGDEVGEVAPARGQRAGRLGRVDQEAVERLLVGDELVDQPPRRRSARG